MQYIHNIVHENTLSLAKEIAYNPGKVSHKTLTSTPYVTLTLFSFPKNEGLATHSSKGDAMVQVLEGSGEFTVDETLHTVSAGETLIMPAGKPHSVYASEAFKMLLTVIFPVN